MRCPHCLFVGDSTEDLCSQCGYKRKSVSSASLHPHTLQPLPSSSRLPTTLALAYKFTLMRGDALNRGRYRAAEPIVLPRNQREQGDAWIAIDTHSSRRRVLLRKIDFPNGIERNAQEIVASIKARFEYLSNYPGFPTFIDIFQEWGSYYLVFQYPAGETLATLIKQQGGALPEREVAEYGRQLCEMLSVLANHQPPLVHGGISPETLVVSLEDHRVFITLFPILPLNKLSNDDNRPPGYLAPEQIKNSNLPSSDIYSLSTTLYHALTGYDPHERLAFFHPPVRRLNPAVSLGMEAILTRGLRLSISQRYPHATDMQKELEALIASYPLVEGSAQQNNIHWDQQGPLTGRNNRGIVTIIGTGLFLLLILLIGVPPLIQSTNSKYLAKTAAVAQQAAMNAELNLEMQSFQKKGIGISDGRLAFDTYPGRTDIPLKTQAAQALQQGNTSLAINLLNQALSADPIDGEAQIYTENLRVLQDNAPYVTIVIGLPIANSDTYLSSDRVTLQAIYLAQQETNTQNLLPHNLKLRILIANSGSNNANVATVAQFINNRVTQDGNLDHIIAVVGWPYSSQTVNALQSIVGANLPLVAPTASSVKLSGISPYFFRVCPADDLQGTALGTLMVSQLGAKKILILHDPTDTYSVSLANAVANQVIGLGATITQATFTEQTTTVDQYQQIVEQAIANNVDTIFMAGYSVDGIRLAHAVGNEARTNPGNFQLSQLKIVGGDTMPGGVLLGEGNNADANIAHTFPQDMRRLVVTSYADADEWNLLGIPQAQQPAFFAEWKTTYQGSQVDMNAPNPTYEGLLGYDATKAILYAATTIHDGAITGDAIHNALTSIGKGKVPAYQGISGRIIFDSKGDPIDKAVVVLAVQDNGNGNQIVIQQVIGAFR